MKNPAIQCAAPWDAPVSEGQFDYTSFDDYRARVNQIASQGYADLSKKAKLPMDTDDAISTALSALVKDPKKTVAYVKDPDKVLSQEQLLAKATQIITGNNYPDYGMFGFDRGDGEIYADGPDVFDDGEWGYEVTQALDSAQNGALRKNPPKVTVERIKGKTAEGWRITVSKPYEYYLNAGLKAAEAEATELAGRGIYPTGEMDLRNRYPKELSQKWKTKAKGKGKMKESFQESFQRLSGMKPMPGLSEAASLKDAGFKVMSDYNPGSSSSEIQVSYFKGLHWNEAKEPCCDACNQGEPCCDTVEESVEDRMARLLGETDLWSPSAKRDTSPAHTGSASQRSSAAKPLEKCPPGHIRNKETNRCISIRGKALR